MRKLHARKVAVCRGNSVGVSLARASCDAVPSISVRLKGTDSSRDSSALGDLTSNLATKIGTCFKG